MIQLELTVPWEDWIVEANEPMRAKYAELVAECRRNGLRVRCEPVKVGCQGFVGHSLWRTLKELQCRRATKNILEAAEKVLLGLWIQKGNPWSRVPAPNLKKI